MHDERRHTIDEIFEQKKKGLRNSCLAMTQLPAEIYGVAALSSSWLLKHQGVSDCEVDNSVVLKDATLELAGVDNLELVAVDGETPECTVDLQGIGQKISALFRDLVIAESEVKGQ